MTAENTEHNLPALVERAANTLLSAKTSAEVLDARDEANAVYHAAKNAGRLARAKDAHDDILAKVYRAQADALSLEAQAKIRLANEYDAAQERGEVAKLGDNLPRVDNDNARPASAQDIGIRRDQIHEARKLRDAEKEKPGIVNDALSEMVASGQEPTKGALRRAIAPKEPKEAKTQDPDAKLRAEYGKLADPEADWIELRKENAEQRKRIADQRGAIADLKAQIKQLQDSDSGKAIGNLHRQVQTLKHSLSEQQKANKRLEYQLKKIQGEVITL